MVPGARVDWKTYAKDYVKPDTGKRYPYELQAGSDRRGSTTTETKGEAEFEFPAGCDRVIGLYDNMIPPSKVWVNIEHRNEKVALFISKMTPGYLYKYEYELTANTPGEFHAMPAKAYTMYNE